MHFSLGSESHLEDKNFKELDRMKLTVKKYLIQPYKQKHMQRPRLHTGDQDSSGTETRK